MRRGLNHEGEIRPSLLARSLAQRWLQSVSVVAARLSICHGRHAQWHVDVSFTAGESKGCNDPRQLRVTGTLPYSELREIWVMKRPEVLIFKTGAEPPALRVTDWVSGNDFQRAVRDLRKAYQGWKSHHRDTK